MASNRFITPQVIFDAYQLWPDSVQDSGEINVALAPAYTEIFAATACCSLWINILAVNVPAGLTRLELYHGGIGSETMIMHMSVPNTVGTSGWTILRAPLRIPGGSRITMRAFGNTCLIEFHLFYKL
jgi:hypothetical protein